MWAVLWFYEFDGQGVSKQALLLEKMSVEKYCSTYLAACVSCLESISMR